MNRIRQLMSSARITSKELSDNTGIPYNSLKNYEYGRREPTGLALVALENYFKVSGAFILGQDCPDLFKKDKSPDTSDELDNIMSTIKKQYQNATPEIKKVIYNILFDISGIVTSDNINKSEQLFFLLESINYSNKFVNNIKK